MGAEKKSIVVLTTAFRGDASLNSRSTGRETEEH